VAWAPHPYVVVAALDHPSAVQKNILLSRLAKEPFLVREKGSDTRQPMEEGFGSHIAGLNIAMEIKSTETIKQTVIAGMDLSFLYAHTISCEPERS
jgi:DNA-binding transcriptional LysR family regulator